MVPPCRQARAEADPVDIRGFVLDRPRAFVRCIFICDRRQPVYDPFHDRIQLQPSSDLSRSVHSWTLPAGAKDVVTTNV